MPSPSLFTANPVSIHGEYIQLQALTGTAPVAASQSVGRIFASGSTAALYFVNQGGVVTALGGADPPTADGDSLGTVDKEWSDLYMADGSVIYLGNDQDVTLTHVHNEGVILNSTMKLFFEDATNKDQYIASLGSGVTGIAAPTEIDLTAPTIDINASSEVNISGDVDVAGHDASSAGLKLGGTLVTSTAAELNLVDGSSANTVVNSKAVIYGSSGEIKGNALSGTTVTVDAITSTGVSTFGSSKHTTLSGTTVQVNQGNLYIDGGRVLTTATELNLLDGDTSVGSSITIATTDGLIVNDGGTTKLVPMSDLEVFMESNLDTLSNVTTVGALNAGSITSGFGNIDNGSSTLDTGAATVASLVCTAAGTFGGGYGSTGATISTAGVIQADGNIETAGSFVIGSADMDETDLEKLDGITNGTAAANKALVLDANKAIGTISHLTASNIKCDTLDVREINSISETALTLEVVDKTILAGLSGSSSDVNNGGYQIGGTIGDGGMARMLWSDTGQALMFYSGSSAQIAIGKDVIGPTANDGAALGMATQAFSDLFLASGAVVNFNNGDVTMTHSANTLTVAGGTLAAAATTATTLTTSGRVQVDDTTEATSTTDGSLQTDGGLSVAKSVVVGDDLDLLSNGAILNIGNGSKFTLTDQNSNNTVMASANHRLAFGDAGEYITGDGTDLSIISSGDLKIDPAGGTVDVDGNIVPNSDSADDLGASGTAWANLYVDAIDLNGQGNISMGGTGRIDLDADDDTSIRASADDVITFEAGGSDRIHLNASALGPASNDGMALGVAGTAFSDLFLASGAVLDFDNGGVTMTHSAGYLTLNPGSNMKAHAFVTYSDARMKKNIKPLDTALDTVQKLRGVSYDWKHDNSSDIGFIAQEVAEVVPSLCHGSEEGGYALDYPSMNALLVEAVKQQQQQIKALSAKVEKLSK